MATIASLPRLVLGGRTPFASRCTIVLGRERSWGYCELESAAGLGRPGAIRAEGDAG